MGTGHVYKIQITKSCRKQIDRAPRQIQHAVEKVLEKISVNPFPQHGVKALTAEWTGFYRVRLGNYRMIYRVEDEIVTIFVVAFGPRGDIYK